MAFKLAFDLPGNFGSVPAYYVVSGITQDRIRSVVTINLVAFKDAAARAAYKAVQAKIADLAKQVQPLRLAQAQAADQAAAATADRSLRLLQIAHDEAISEQNAIAALDDPNKITFSGDDYAAVTDADGDVSIASVYERLATLPRFKDAEKA